MVKRVVSLAAALVASLLVNGAAADESLGVGSKAPELAVGKWVQGEPVKGFEAGKTYVVEFWATWCGPCRATIPHLNDLSKQYKDKVTFVGVSVWEDDPSGVEPFVKEMGDKMTYPVALDRIPEGGTANDGAMATNWMKAASQDGIPAAFIVNGEGKVAWIGHPTQIDGPLEQVVAGTFDIAAAAAEQKKMAEKAKVVEQLGQKYQDAMQAGDPKKTIEVIDEIVAALPESEAQLGVQKYTILLTQIKDTPAAVEYGTKYMESLKLPDEAKAQLFNQLAWTMVDPEGPEVAKPDLDFALKAALESSKLSGEKNAAILDTVGLIQFKLGKVEEAIATQTKAVEIAKDEASEDLAELESRLKEFKAAKDKP